jgi:ankyrin repeat protein
LNSPSDGIEGETALMLAARRRCGLMCFLFLSLGADPNIRSTKGKTASFIARSCGWVEIAGLQEKLLMIIKSFVNQN